MAYVLQPWQPLVAVLAGRVNEHRQAAIEYLREENRALREQFGKRRPSLVLRDAFGLSHRVGRTTIAGILRRHGIEPAPQRGKRMTWSRFLKAQWSAFAAADFFTVEVWGSRGLVSFYVFFVIELSTRRVEIVRLPPRSPNLNAYAERFVRSIEDECLNRMISFGERSLRKATRGFAARYLRKRNHQSIENRLIDAATRRASASGAVECSDRLGGMLRFYRRAVA